MKSGKTGQGLSMGSPGDLKEHVLESGRLSTCDQGLSFLICKMGSEEVQGLTHSTVGAPSAPCVNTASQHVLTT